MVKLVLGSICILKIKQWNMQYVPYVLQLATDVEKNYGDLNIVQVARAVAVVRSTSTSLGLARKGE